MSSGNKKYKPGVIIDDPELSKFSNNIQNENDKGKKPNQKINENEEPNLPLIPDGEQEYVPPSA